MDGVEAAKASLPKYDGDAAKAFCQQFALSVFKRADDEDRLGRSATAELAAAREEAASSTYISERVCGCIHVSEHVRDERACDTEQTLRRRRPVSPLRSDAPDESSLFSVVT